MSTSKLSVSSICAVFSSLNSIDKSLTIISPSCSIISFKSSFEISSGGSAIILPVLGSYSNHSGISEPSSNTSFDRSKFWDISFGRLIIWLVSIWSALSV